MKLLRSFTIKQAACVRWALLGDIVLFGVPMQSFREAPQRGRHRFNFPWLVCVSLLVVMVLALGIPPRADAGSFTAVQFQTPSGGFFEQSNNGNELSAISIAQSGVAVSATASLPSGALSTTAFCDACNFVLAAAQIADGLIFSNPAAPNVPIPVMFEWPVFFRFNSLSGIGTGPDAVASAHIDFNSNVDLAQIRWPGQDALIEETLTLSVLALPDGQTIYPFLANIVARFGGPVAASGYISVDPAITLVLPPGVSFSSSSGVFLSGSSPVPEPASILLLGSGLAGLAWWRRKHVA